MFTEAGVTMNWIAVRALVLCTVLSAIVAPPVIARAGNAVGVARVRVVHGDVDVRRVDSGDTVAAAINAPIAVGDDLTTHADARAEIEFDYGTVLRVAPQSEVRFTKLDARDHVVQLTVGSAELRVFRTRGARASIETTAGTLRPRGVGRYRATVTSDARTRFVARAGAADIVTDRGTTTLAKGEALAAGATVSADESAIGAPKPDAFDRWSDTRDRSVASEGEGAYLDADIVGAGDLGAYGRWHDDARYGRVWSPNVAAGWAPYHDGRFVWEPYYGWTWVAAEPWGWAPYHYGNWYYANSGWCWYPGALSAQPFAYRPAVVAFFFLGGFGSALGSIGWVPLAPFEPFHPWYGGYPNVTVINDSTNATRVTNVVNVPPETPGKHTYTIYHNIAVPGGFVALGRDAFTSGRFGRIDTVSQSQRDRATVIRGVLPIAPEMRVLSFARDAVRATLVPAVQILQNGSPAASRIPTQRPAALPERSESGIRFEHERAFDESTTLRRGIMQPSVRSIPQPAPAAQSVHPLRAIDSVRPAQPSSDAMRVVSPHAATPRSEFRQHL